MFPPPRRWRGTVSHRHCDRLAVQFFQARPQCRV